MKDHNIRLDDPVSGRSVVVTVSVDEAADSDNSEVSVVGAVWEDTETKLTAEELQGLESELTEQLSS